MFSVYILYSHKLDRYYVGQTEDMAKRLVEHNTGMSSFTAKATDWKCVFAETFSTRNAAVQRELQIKRKKSRQYIEWLIAQA